MPKIVVCPHCGVQNPYSLLVTICQQCKGELGEAEPIEAPLVEEPVRAAPPEALTTRDAQVVPDRAAAPRVSEPGAPSVVTGEPPAKAAAVRPAAEAEAPEREETQAPARPGVRVPIAEVGQPPVVPSAPAERPTAERRADGRVGCQRCGYTNRPGSISCSRCGAALRVDQAAAPTGLRSCARCGHRQDARRASCERCGMHFLGPGLQATVALTRQPLRRAPKSSGEDVTRGCAVAAGCILAFALAFWVLIALLTMR